MANLRLSKLILNDRWPGVPDLRLGVPTGGWDNTVDNFSSADDTQRALNAHPSSAKTRVPLGQKRQAYTDNTNCPGSYTMMYLCLHSFEDGMDISKDFSDGHLFHMQAGVGCISCSEWADTSRGPYHVVSRCTTGGEPTRGMPVAIFCSTHTYSDGTGVNAAGYGDGYGWAWVGGVCPCKDITIMDDGSGNTKGVDLTVDAGVGRGPVFLCQTDAAALLFACDETNILDLTSGVVVDHEPGSMAIGWACVSAA